jgi:hypothetical protein
MRHLWRHVLTATLNRHAKSEQRSSAMGWVWRVEVLLDERAKSGENLGWWKVRGEAIDDTKSRLRINDECMSLFR